MSKKETLNMGALFDRHVHRIGFRLEVLPLTGVFGVHHKQPRDSRPPETTPRPSHGRRAASTVNLPTSSAFGLGPADRRMHRVPVGFEQSDRQVGHDQQILGFGLEDVRGQ